MNTKYYVYQGATCPIVSCSELKGSITIPDKQKYSGKRAKIEAIFRFSNVRLSSDSTTKEINDYIDKNLFGTGNWAAYHRIFTEVIRETVSVTHAYKFLGYINCEISDWVRVGAERIAVNPEDERVCHFLAYEYMGKHLKTYKGMKNPILKFEKI